LVIPAQLAEAEQDQLGLVVMELHLQYPEVVFQQLQQPRAMVLLQVELVEQMLVFLLVLHLQILMAVAVQEQLKMVL
jgi:hypothetical protein